MLRFFLEAPSLQRDSALAQKRECATSYVVHRATSMWSSLMTMNGIKTVIIYSLETIYQTLINLKASFQGNEVVAPMPASVHGDPLYNSLSFGLAIHTLNGFVESTADKVNGP